MLTMHFRASLTVAIVTLLLSIGLKSGERQRYKKRYEFLKDETQYANVLLQLVAVVIKADSNTTDSEFRYIEDALNENFSQRRAQVFMQRIKNIYLKKDFPYQPICNFILENYTSTERIQILHLLTGIATADGLLTSKEMEILKDIARHLRIPYRTFLSILAMFHFRKEWEKQEEKKTYARRSIYSLDLAYQVLGIAKSATDKEVKKAYRKLAVQHHPDKVIHMGKEFQKAAKEKFQKILEAYEKIKASRGFS